MRVKQARLGEWIFDADEAAGHIGASKEPFDTFDPLGERRASASSLSPSPHVPHDRPRLLVAESDPYHRRVLRMLLANPNISAIEVEDGQSAIDLLSLRSFDVILLGMSLPVMSGPDVLQWVRRSLTPWADIPIVGLIDEAHRNQVGRLLSMGLTDWTPMPVNRTDLADKLVGLMPGLAGSGL